MNGSCAERASILDAKIGLLTLTDPRQHKKYAFSIFIIFILLLLLSCLNDVACFLLWNPLLFGCIVQPIESSVMTSQKSIY